MNKLLLIDGNSMLFRAYYGTLSRGTMKSSNGVVTNAVYGFSTMLNKAIEMIEPTHILVAFDTADKTFRHEMFDDYKGHRKEVDENLVSQFALVREFLDEYPMVRYELSGYEADDIIGTLSRACVDFKVEILTSDRDMLQLIDDHVDVLLMRKGLTDINLMTSAKLHEEMGITPSQIVDIKALQGDISDNIPGVPSIGEKTAMKLIHQYGTLDNLYLHKDEVKGKMGEKLREFEEQARLSYELATIHTEVPLDLDINSLVSEIPNDSLNAFYRKYDMNSLVTKDVDVVLEDKADMMFEPFSINWTNVLVHADVDKNEELVGVFLTDGRRHDYLNLEEMRTNTDFHQLLLRPGLKTSSAKVLYRFALDQSLVCAHDFEDILLLAFICDASTTTMSKLKDVEQLWFHEYEGLDKGHAFAAALGPLFDRLLRKAMQDAVYSVYETIEKPLTWVLANCEFDGISVDVKVLNEIAETTLAKIDALTKVIYEMSGVEFNINSPKQLGEVLFDTMQIPSKKKRSTAVDVLEALAPDYPIMTPILEYRKYQKLYSTYAIGLSKHIGPDHKIHTRFNQHAAQTGRLSSSEPNLQNLSVRDEESRHIRRAFVASPNHKLVSIDYSQIELRVLSYAANEDKMIEIFNKGEDIHSSTARDIFGVDEINSDMRRQAKSVNFGIIYGMSSYGLSKQLDIPISDAAHFIERYNEIYPNISTYMDNVIASCEKTGYASTLFHRRRYIPEINDSNRAVKDFGKRAAMNAPIQGTAADIIKIAMVNAFNALEKHGFKSKMILQVHDELVFDVVNEELDALIPIMKQAMTSVVDWSIDLDVSVSIGDNWMEDDNA